jgi:hypothetical protein
MKCLYLHNLVPTKSILKVKWNFSQAEKTSGYPVYLDTSTNPDTDLAGNSANVKAGSRILGTGIWSGWIPDYCRNT